MTSDITRELRSARPVAGNALRERVRAIAASPPQPTRGPSLAAFFGGRRSSFFVAVPAAAALAVVAAGAIALTRSGPDTVGREALEARTSAMGAADAQVPAPAGQTESAAAGTGASGAAGAAGADAERAAKSAAPPATAPSLSAGGRAQRFSATLTLEVKNTDALSEATQRAIETTRALGGYLVTVAYGATDRGSSSLTLRVPSSRVQDAIAQLSALGTIVGQQVQIDDLQASLDETNRRIGVLRKRIAAITARLEDTSLTTEEKAELQATRQNLRDELAGSRRQSQAISDEAQFATIQLSLNTKTKESAVPAPPSRFDRAVDDALEILAVEGIVALFVGIIAVPLAALGLGVWTAVRVVSRRGSEKLLASG
jgi:hypothetical protein